MSALVVVALIWASVGVAIAVYAFYQLFTRVKEYVISQYPERAQKR